MSSRKTPEWVIVFEKGKGNEEADDAKFGELLEEITSIAGNMDFTRKGEFTKVNDTNKLRLEQPLQPALGDYCITFCLEKSSEATTGNEFGKLIKEIEGLSQEKGFPMKGYGQLASSLPKGTPSDTDDKDIF